MVGIIQSKIILQQFPAFKKKNWTLSKKVFEKLRPQQVMTMKQHPPLMGRHSSPGQLQSGLQLAQGLTWPKTEHVLCKKQPHYWASTVPFLFPHQWVFWPPHLIGCYFGCCCFGMAQVRFCLNSQGAKQPRNIGLFSR
jgi:hypothetical protein